MKYVFTVTLSSRHGIENKDIEFIGLPDKVYEFEPVSCIPNNSIVLGVSATHGAVLDYTEVPNPERLLELCCLDDRLGDPHIYDPASEIEPQPTPSALQAPLAPYDLSTATGSVVVAWFHNNAEPYTAEQFDVYRSYDGVTDWKWIKSIWAIGKGIRVYNIRDEDYNCGGEVFYKVAASNKIGRAFSEPIGAVVESCTPTPTPTPTDRCEVFDICFPTPTPTPMQFRRTGHSYRSR